MSMGAPGQWPVGLRLYKTQTYDKLKHKIKITHQSPPYMHDETLKSKQHSQPPCNIKAMEYSLHIVTSRHEGVLESKCSHASYFVKVSRKLRAMFSNAKDEARSQQKHL